MRHINLDKYADQYLTLDCFVCKKILKLFIFGSFGVQHLPKETEKFIRHKNIKTNIFRIQANN